MQEEVNYFNQEDDATLCQRYESDDSEHEEVKADHKSSTIQVDSGNYVPSQSNMEDHLILIIIVLQLNRIPDSGKKRKQHLGMPRWYSAFSSNLIFSQN